MELVPEGVDHFDETGIVSENGSKDEFDVVVMATGFEVTEFLTPMEIIGRGRRALKEQWKENRGPQAYYGCFVHNFPNSGMLFGPNTFPAHNSALFVIETGVEFISSAMIVPILDRRARVVEVKSSAEDRCANRLQSKVRDAVYQAGCSNWYVNEYGRNVTSWPGYAITYYLETMFPISTDFETVSDSEFWIIHSIKRWFRSHRISLATGLILAIIGALRIKGGAGLRACIPRLQAIAGLRGLYL